ncbi:MAG: hypothetical protein H7A23_18200 [Leptospiraceae bacterium]|nr:hypothetical protein [Leptospiraceae bacterium]
MSLLQIKISQSEEELCIEASSASGTKEFTLPYEEIDDRFQFVYDCLEDLETKKADEFSKSIQYLSEKIIQPIKDLLEEVDHICFFIDTDFVCHAYDLLEANGKPLFLTHAITYTITDFEIDEDAEIEIEDGLIVSDKTCDPEKACKILHAKLTNCEYYEMEDISVEEIEEEADDVSLLLISAHGELDDDNSGEITINDESLTDDELENIDCTIVYFDSCQMGVNVDFLEVFSEEETTQYYMAPIISNDAGDSSTNTILWFFENLEKAKNPTKSLFATKKKLYQHYSEKKLDKITILNKAFPFRLYEFDVEEDD